MNTHGMEIAIIKAIYHHCNGLDEHGFTHVDMDEVMRSFPNEEDACQCLSNLMEMNLVDFDVTSDEVWLSPEALRICS